MATHVLHRWIGLGVLIKLLLLMPVICQAQQTYWAAPLGPNQTVCTNVAFASTVNAVQGKVVVGGGCTDYQCVNRSNVICFIDPAPLVNAGNALRVVNASGGSMPFAGPTALVKVLASLYLVPACTLTTQASLEGPNNESILAALNDVYEIDLDTGATLPIERPIRTDGTARANASCVVVGQHLFVVGGVLVDRDGVVRPSRTIDVVKFVLNNVTLVSTDALQMPSTASTQFVGVNSFSEGFAIITKPEQPAARTIGLSFYYVYVGGRYNATGGVFSTQIDQLTGNEGFMTYVTALTTNGVRILRDPYQAMASGTVSSSGFALLSLVDITDAVTVYGSSFSVVAAEGKFTGVLFGGCSNGQGRPGPPVNTIQALPQSFLVLPSPDYSATSPTGYVGQPFAVHLLSTAPRQYFFRLSPAADCSVELSETIPYSDPPLHFTPRYASSEVYFCVSQGIINSVPTTASGVTGPVYFFAVTNPERPFQIVPADDHTTPAPVIPTVPPTAPPPPPTTTTVAPSLPPTTNAPPPPTRHPPSGNAQIPVGGWVGGVIALIVLGSLVGCLVVASVHPESLCGRLLRRATALLRPRGHTDHSIMAIAGSQLTVLRKIGAGGWGAVYLCRRDVHPGDKDEIVAVKHVICSCNVAKALVLREIRVLQGVQGHPNIVRVFEMVVRESIDTTAATASIKKPSIRTPLLGPAQHDDDAVKAAVATLHEAAAATYGFRTQTVGGGGHRAAHSDNGGSFCDVESFGSGDFGLDEEDDDEQGPLTSERGNADQRGNGSLRRSSHRQTTPGAELTPAPRPSSAKPNRRQTQQRVQRYLCIVMRYYAKGDLCKWLASSSFVLDPSYNTEATDFPSLRRALPVHSGASSSTVFDDTAVVCSSSSLRKHWLSGPAGQAAAQDCPVEVVQHTAPEGFGTPIPETLLLSIAVQLSSVLMHLHHRSILHCDIKPQNVLVADEIPKPYLARKSRTHAKKNVADQASKTPSTPSPQDAAKLFLPIVVTDFGVAQVINNDRRKRKEQPTPRDVTTSHGLNHYPAAARAHSRASDHSSEDSAEPSDSTPAGFTLPYLAPECVESGMALFSDKTDVWAMGVLLYGMASKQVLSGEIETCYVFERSRRVSPGSFSSLIAADLMLVGYTREFSELVGRMLEPDPSLRPSAGRIMADIVRVAPLRYAVVPRRAHAADALAPYTPEVTQNSTSCNPPDLAVPLLEDW